MVALPVHIFVPSVIFPFMDNAHPMYPLVEEPDDHIPPRNSKDTEPVSLYRHEIPPFAIIFSEVVLLYVLVLVLATGPSVMRPSTSKSPTNVYVIVPPLKFTLCGHTFPLLVIVAVVLTVNIGVPLLEVIVIPETRVTFPATVIVVLTLSVPT